MPKITQLNLQKSNNKRCNLFLDDNFFCGISIETVMKNRLKVGDEIEEQTLSRLIFESERSEALAKATDYALKSLKTKKQVKDYLLKKGYSEEIVWYCIDKLKEYDYINDCEYSKKYIESTSKTQGKRLLEYKLMMKGVKKEDIESAFLQSEVDSKNNAKSIADKYLKNKEHTKENIAKAYRYLIGKGFSYDDASYALGSLNRDD